MAENDFRFATFTPAEVQTHPGFELGPVDAAAAKTGIALFRLNFALFGWPFTPLFAFCALRFRRTRVFWASALFFPLVLFFQQDSGVDTFGPVHYAEMSLSILVLTVLGLAAATDRLSSLAPPPASGEVTPLRLFPAALFAALILTAWAGYVPVRFRALHRIAENINMPFEAVADAGLEDAVVFAPWPFAPPCRSAPTRHFVFMRPANDPDLENEVLWVNHIGVAEDKRLMAHFPERRGWVLQWTQDCEVALLPLEQLREGDLPPQIQKASP